MDSEGSSRLFLACLGNYVEVVKFLLKPGADMEVRDNTDQAAALCAAAIRGRTKIEVVRLLLAHGANVNVQSGSGDSTLLSALGHEGKVQLLLDAGADQPTKPTIMG